MTSERRWALAVRVLALLSAVLVAIAGLEARTIRRLRSDVQQLRNERDQQASGVISAWTRAPADELGEAVRSLDRIFAEPGEGVGRPGGLCRDSHLDDQAIVRYIGGEFLPARAAGRTLNQAIEKMNAAVKQKK